MTYKVVDSDGDNWGSFESYDQAVRHAERLRKELPLGCTYEVLPRPVPEWKIDQTLAKFLSDLYPNYECQISEEAASGDTIIRVKSGEKVVHIVLTRMQVEVEVSNPGSLFDWLAKRLRDVEEYFEPNKFARTR